MRQVTALIAHQAETGGEPGGLGLPGFLTLLVGIVAVAYMAGRYVKALRTNREGTFDANSASTWGEHQLPEPQP